VRSKQVSAKVYKVVQACTIEIDAPSALGHGIHPASTGCIRVLWACCQWMGRASGGRRCGADWAGSFAEEMKVIRGQRAVTYGEDSHTAPHTE
jgi:hypothetical protein